MAHDITNLLRLAKNGQGAQLGEILEAYSRYLTLLARVQIGRRLQGKVDPADVVQEVFLEVHRQFPHFRGETEAEFLAWMRKILAGQLALVMRKYLGTQARDIKLEQQLEAQVDRSSQMLDGALAASISTPSQRASRKEQALLLSQALDRLDEDYREVIILRHLEGLGFDEVARRMERSADSVQKLWVRALGKLRQSLGELA